MEHNLKKWMAVGQQFNRRYQAHHIGAYASNVSFYVLLSLFPFLMGMTEILRVTAFKDPLFQEELWGWLPAEAYAIIQAIMDNLSSNESGLTLPIAIAVTLWSASKGALSLLRGLRIAFEQETNTNFILNRIFAFIYTIGFILLIFASGLVLVFGQIILDFMKTNLGFELPVDFYRLKDWVPFLMLIVMISLAYYGIVRKKYRFIQILPGAVLAAIGFLLSAMGMTYYIRFSANLSYMYGSIAGIAGMMMWLNICSHCLLLGAEINSMLKQRQRINRKK
ncbi:YihY/virulence factor BrkB family protein [Clostridiales bacterium COT073_COT-073]|nr:YihY/virulence factor BrkB family protein [Clostridiales bacterium COT073_COT-073]